LDVTAPECGDEILQESERTSPAAEEPPEESADNEYGSQSEPRKLGSRKHELNNIERIYHESEWRIQTGQNGPTIAGALQSEVGVGEREDQSVEQQEEQELNDESERPDLHSSQRDTSRKSVYEGGEQLQDQSKFVEMDAD